MMAAIDRGPYVCAALLCERVLCEADGTLSAIRIVREGIAGREDPPTRLVLFLTLVRGAMAPGEHRASLQITGPSAEVVSRKEISFTLDDGGPEQASSLVLDVAFTPRSAGVYWFHVFWGEPTVELTRTPFTARLPRPAEAMG